ncbi:D-serine dehydratase [Kwoniella heveanensis CBS 569]|nr:D-serine dehydratase [Kwoniella heveanensis CBS 569]
MVEVWKIIEEGLVDEGLVDDILYSMPIGGDKIPDIDAAQQRVGDKAIVRVMVDHPAQIGLLDKFNEQSGRTLGWGVFVKVDGGGRRAGVPPTSDQMKDLIKAIVASKHVDIFGFYSHFGQSYASDSLSKGSDYFAGEVECVSAAARVARELGASGSSWVFSVGATPTAHAAVSESEGELNAQIQGLDGVLELHAGCYCMCDLQQHATTLVPTSSLALTVLARVVSLYPHRGQGPASAQGSAQGEAMCDAGALALSKDTGPYPGFGRVIAPAGMRDAGWEVGRISQEHGTLVQRKLQLEGAEEDSNRRWEDTESEGGANEAAAAHLEIGQMLRIVPQHACLACANFPWIYVTDGDGEGDRDEGGAEAGATELEQQVVDVWVPWKGW